MTHINNINVKIAFWAVVLLAIVTRLYHLDAESLFMDELRQVSYYGNTFYEMIALAASQNQTPLDYWIGHVIYYYAQSDFAVRLPAAMFGIGSVIILMLLVARISGWHFAILAGIVMALLPFHIYFSQDARPYAIAIFFLLLLLWILVTILETHTPSKKHYLALLFIACCFLLSRTLSPLVSVTSIIGLLLLQGIVLIKNEGFLTSPLQKKLFLSISVLILAILIYLPNLLFILQLGKSYAPQASQIDLNMLYQGVQNFSLIQIWQAYLVQLEPLGYPLFILSFLSCILVFMLPKWRKNPILITVILLLPLASILHTFIFMAKTSMPLRPPYAIYIMPLALIGSTHVLHEFWKRMTTLSGKIILTIVSFLMLGSLLYTTQNFYNTPKKTDWRGLAQYLEQHTDTRHILLSDTFVKHPNFPRRAWEPNFYGFGRYYTGKAPGIELYKVPFMEKTLLLQPLQPVLILFEWRDYFLTSLSPYPFIPNNNRQQLDFSQLVADHDITMTHFTGFYVLQLREQSRKGTFAKNTLKLLRTIVPLLPKDSAALDILTVISMLENAQENN